MFLTPLAGLILGLVVLPPLILLYFLKLRRREQATSCTLLWKKSIEDLHANAPFQRLRKSILLFLQLFVLGMLILAIMQPQMVGSRQQGGKVVFLIDNSASMTATDTDDQRTRLAHAKELARQKIEGMYGRGLFSDDPGESMVIAFSDRAEIVSRFTNSKQQLLDAIDRIRPTHGPSQVQQAFDLARAYTTNPNPDAAQRPINEPARFELFSDGAITDLAEMVLRGEQLAYTPVGSVDADNIAIGTLSVERPYNRLSEVEVFASFLNFNNLAQTISVQLSVDGTVRAISDTEIPAATVNGETGERRPGRSNVVFPAFELPRDSVIEIANLRDDAMAADNLAQLIVPPPHQLDVALVNSQSFVLQAVLEGMPLKSLRLISPTTYDAMVTDHRADEFDVIIFDDHVPEVLPDGRFLIFGPPPPLEGLNPYGEGSGMVILDANDQHPALTYVELDNLVVQDYHKVQPDDSFEVLAEGNTGPVMIQYSKGGRHMIYVAFDILESNWPFNRSFVTFVYNAVEYLGQLGEGLSNQAFKPGDAVTVRLPAAADKIRLREPDGNIDQLRPMNPEYISWGPARLSGVHLISYDMPGAEDTLERAVAVNMPTESESDIAVRTDVSIGTEKIEGQAADADQYVALWPYAVVLALVVLMLEWWVYHRKTYV